jgi:uncharacterized protein
MRQLARFVLRLATVSLLATLATISTAVVADDKPANAAKTAASTRIVVQVNEDDAKKWNGILANIHNIQEELGKTKVAIAVVAIGPGLDMLMADSLAANGVQDAMADGVEFVACENTMKARKIKKDDLLDGIGYTHAGYVEIVRRQQQGWAYLRP